MLRLALYYLTALVACDTGGRSINGEGVSERGGGGLASLSNAPTPDWSGKKLVAQEGTVEGVTFTLQVPEGLPRDPRQPGDWEDERHEYDHAPKIFTQTIEIRRIQSLDEAKYHAALDSKNKTWVRADARPDGWAVTYAEPDKSRVEAVTYRQVSDTHFIKCKAVQATASGPLPSYAKTREMLETICESIKAKDVAKQPVSAPAGEPAKEPN